MKRIINQLSLWLMLVAFLAAFPLSAIAQDLTVTGKVTTGGNEPLPGASIVVKGTQRGASTDVDGNFSVKVNEGEILQFISIGFATQEIAATSGIINVDMAPDAVSLDEVVVTALGIKKDAKRVGYAVSRISTEDLTKTGTSNFASSLYGKAAGVRIQSAPGGSTSAVSINIRGLNSITGSNQPLVVIDGVPIRNGDANSDGFWGQQRINSNGLVDINPEDIADLSILKGASASALYGSEAANGVVLITTKSGKSQSGLGVDFNMNFSFDKLAYMPKYQDSYGPGEGAELRGGQFKENGWGSYTYNGRTYEHPDYEAQPNFGPAFDGREVLYWDGSTRSYSASKNRWNELFRTGTSSSYNLAISQGNEKSNFRFSYTFSDNKAMQKESKNNKHNFNIVGAYSLSKHFKIEYTATYMRQNVTNRPYRISRITNNYAGMFSTFDDVGTMWDKTVTSAGYVNTRPGEQTVTPDEALLFNIAAFQLMDSYIWQVRKRRNEEVMNRLISSVTPTITITDWLSLRGRIATDLTANKVEEKEYNNRPLAIGRSGSYSLNNNKYETYYGDVLLMLNRDLTESLNLTANVGYQGRIEEYYESSVSTRDGLAVENWFHLNASQATPNAGMRKRDLLKQAFLGTVGLSYNNYLFLEATARQEKSSTLPSGSNSFFYPSVNAGFIFTDAFRDAMPSWFDFGKLRASWGIVGNAPEIYSAYVGYDQNTMSGFIYNGVPTALGNDGIKPEKKHELEFGLEAKFFQNRLGFDVTYYTNTTKDQILRTTTPGSSGATSVLMNVGELSNKGVEISVYGTPIQTKDFRWDVRGNISFNKNKVNKLAPGLPQLEHRNIDNGAVLLVSNVGGSMGDVYMNPVLKDASGRVMVRESDGLPLRDRSRYEKVGNAMPDASGGGAMTFTYKNLSLDAGIDFNIGGHILNTPYQYMMCLGLLEESMDWRDSGNGGQSYYYSDPSDVTSKKIPIAANSSNGPNGERVWNDGVLFSGVNSDGSANDYMAAAPTYYTRVYGWGNGGTVRTYENSLFKNTYVKMRELSLSYRLPESISSKIACKNLTVSAFGRNLFFFYKNLPAFDAEATDATTWTGKFEIGGSSATARTFGFSIRASF